MLALPACMGYFSHEFRSQDVQQGQIGYLGDHVNLTGIYAVYLVTQPWHTHHSTHLHETGGSVNSCNVIMRSRVRIAQNPHLVKHEKGLSKHEKGLSDLEHSKMYR